MTHEFFYKLGNNVGIMDSSKNLMESTGVFPHANIFRRSISEHPTMLAPRTRRPSDAAFVFSSIDENNDQDLSSNSVGTLSTTDEKTSRHHFIIEIPTKENFATPSVVPMHPLNAWYRRTIPDYLTCHHIWLVIHVLLTLTLCALYFTQILGISAGSLAIIELLFGVLVRNEPFVAVLHRLVALIPFCRYEINRMLHCIGGLHVSSAVSAFFWLLISLIDEPHGLIVRITGAIIVFIIAVLSLTALPVVRRRFHNTFEHAHRYIGWTSLIILIVHVIFLQIDNFDHFRKEAILNLSVLLVIIIIVIIFLPWMCVRKVAVHFSQPSKDLTLITFPRALYPYGSTTRISLDGHEWHAFAIALANPREDQHSILVAAVGDWTKNLAAAYQADKLPKQLWIRRIKGLGFMYSIHAYQMVLIVCTGSGIAPALPYIKDPLPTTHTHLLWIAKQHEKNYGDSIWQIVQRTSPNFTLHDTAISGRPHPSSIEEHYWKTRSQAVFVVSNEKFTNEAINALWRKGIPCFGALFDS